MDFAKKPVFACVHLLPTPGSPSYDGNIDRVYETALNEAKTFVEQGVDALIVENFRDGPFYPDRVPVETVAAIAAVCREVVRSTTLPVGVAVLRNDAEAAVAIAAATNAAFVRVNVHVGAVLAAQGVLYGKAHLALRLRSILQSKVGIFADVGVKHSYPWAYPDISEEIRDASPFAEALVVSGALTGVETSTVDLAAAKHTTKRPVLIGSGVTTGNLEKVFAAADGFIVGSYFKVDGIASNAVDAARVRAFMDRCNELRRANA